MLLVGLWLWKGGGMPQERELFLQVQGRGAPAVRALEVQLSSPEGELLKRSELHFPGPPPSEVSLKARLPEGRLPVLLFARDAQGRLLSTQRQEVEVTDAEAYVVRVTVSRTEPLPEGR